MEGFLWAALGVLVLAAVAGGAFVGLRAWRAWQAFTSLAAAAGAAAERLLADGAAIAAHGERAVRAEELVAAVERLQRSVGRAQILLGAAGEATELVRAVRGFVPEK
jgi:hypothetical protein